MNVNASSPAQLQFFACTGPVLAARLASGRPYGALEAVDAVKGVGPSWLAVNGPHVALSGPATCSEPAADLVTVRAVPDGSFSVDVYDQDGSLASTFHLPADALMADAFPAPKGGPQ